jgi:hypothetical protein
METSNALDLEPGVFKLRTPRAVAESLKRSAERSHRRKSDPYRSAMSMLTFHINRAGRSLSPSRKKVLENAKRELRAVFGRGSTRANVKRRAAPTVRRRQRLTAAAR